MATALTAVFGKHDNKPSHSSEHHVHAEDCRLETWAWTKPSFLANVSIKKKTLRTEDKSPGNGEQVSTRENMC